MQFASWEVAKVTSACTVMARLYPQGDTHPASSCGYSEKYSPNKRSHGIIKKLSHLRKSNGPHGVLVKILQRRDGKVFLVWLQSSSSRRTAMAGSGWNLPSPPLRSHTSAAFTAAVTVTGSPGRNHSALSAGGGGQGCRSRPQQQQQL